MSTHKTRYAGTAAALSAAAVLLAGCASGEPAPENSTAVAPVPSISAGTATPGTPPVTTQADCQPAKPDTRKPEQYNEYTPPAKQPKTWKLATNCGNITIKLDPGAPITNDSIAFLSSKGYYNNTACHRLVTEGIYVLQCGDPSGTGTGTPGYALEEENLPKADKQGLGDYPAGTVAMANAGTATTGSQFFIVYADTKLPSAYTIVGEVTKGLDIVEQIAEEGVQGGLGDGTPNQQLVIKTSTVK